jgi:hypothetical protein
MRVKLALLTVGYQAMLAWCRDNPIGSRCRLESVAGTALLSNRKWLTRLLHLITVGRFGGYQMNAGALVPRGATPFQRLGSGRCF